MSTHARLYLSLVVNKGAKPVAGDVLDPDYESQIEVEDWQWTLTRPDGSDGRAAAGADVMRTTPGDFTFRKLMDRASTQMLTLLASGEELTAVVTLTQNAELAFKLVVRLEKVRISGYALNAKDEQKRTSIDESWVFRYETLTFEHHSRAGHTKSTQALTTQHQRSPKDNARPADNVPNAVALDFKRLGSDDQEAVLRDINAVRR